MGSNTQTFPATGASAGIRNAYALTTATNSVVASGGTFSVSRPTVQCRVGTNHAKGYIWADLNVAISNSASLTYNTANGNFVTVSGSNWVTLSGGSAVTLATSKFFNQNNPTTKSVGIPYYMEFFTMIYEPDEGTISHHDYLSTIRSLGNLTTVTLNAPPTFDTTQVSFDTPYVYAGFTTASVTVSNVSAKYGGNISSVVFKIGNQTATGTGNETLQIPLESGGTFTPTVTVTDSRGQVTTTNLDSITVNVYQKPTAIITSAQRTENDGKPKDDGTFVTIGTKYTHTNDIASLSVPTVSVKSEQGISYTQTVVWYSSRSSDGTLSNPISDWSTVNKGQVVYGLLSITNGFNTLYSYQVFVTPNDTIDSGSVVSQTIAPEYQTIDFLSGGHGISFGAPINEEELYESVSGATAPTFEVEKYYKTVTSGDMTDYVLLDTEPSDWSTNWVDYYIQIHEALFKCNMDAQFRDKANIMRALFDFMHPVGSYYETSDVDFDPNVTWGGTWVKDSAGRVTVAQDTTDTAFDTIGDTGGSKDAVLVSHTHSVTATQSGVSITGGSHAHPVYYRNDNSVGGSADRLGVSSTHAGTRANAATATTHSHTLPAHTHTLNTQGVAGTDQNLQPYIVVNRWHRVA